MSKAVEKKITDAIASEMDAAGYDLVRVQVQGGGKFATLQIMAERKDGVGMTVEDCAAISKSVTSFLEADEALAGRYDLEVSSPGIDRPLVKLADYVRFAGHVAKVDLAEMVEGRKRLQGAIKRVAGENVEFDVDGTVLVVPFAAIDRAKLVLTDALLKAAASGAVTH